MGGSRTRVCAAVALLAAGVLLGSCLSRSDGTRQATGAADTTVTIDVGRGGHSFVPSEALGAAVDGTRKGDVGYPLRPAVVSEMRSAGLGSVSYRLRTELLIEAWHWNPEGTWSDAAHRQGYWTSSDRSTRPILTSSGYNLPRRGNTFDKARSAGYSRLDDGDQTTFWKSDPYLTSRYTGDPDSAHPQWVVIRLDQPADVGAVLIDWGTPWALDYQVEYWDGEDPIFLDPSSTGQWRPLNGGSIHGGGGGQALIRFGSAPRPVGFLRILMTRSSNTRPAGSTDVRDGVGYAIRELHVGTVDSGGRFHDVMRHGQGSDRQTVTYASSTDPWHRAVDKDPGLQQPGLDYVVQSGLTGGLPMMTPVALLYDTPDNAAAEIRYLKWRKYPTRRIEMGEEPDGQYVSPEDYAALYVQWARILHTADPLLQFGGPGFQGTTGDWVSWPDGRGERSWIRRFLGYLRSHDAASELAFFSFEWYPFDRLDAPAQPQLVEAPDLLSEIIRKIREDGVPPEVPLIVSEYGYSSSAGRTEVELPGAILNAEIAAGFIAEGGSATYLYGWPPAYPISDQPHAGHGNLMMFLADGTGGIRAKMPTYWAASLLTHEWAQPGQGANWVYAGTTHPRDVDGRPLVTSYAVHRPDGTYSLLLLNKDGSREHDVSVRFHGPGGELRFRDEVDVYSYSPAQYRWHPSGRDGHPDLAVPPAHTVVSAAQGPFRLPPFSITVISGRLSAARGGQ